MGNNQRKNENKVGGTLIYEWDTKWGMANMVFATTRPSQMELEFSFLRQKLKIGLLGINLSLEGFTVGDPTLSFTGGQTSRKN